ncbi:LysR family transcriptional regulator [Methylocella tundrae]|uniref:LysR family transcriptional regulator n=1 Tax=Methylocella tundrae TaxID=227605 RepID=A0A4V6IMR8_METTU|nr:LysR family transcriptional regulator [Methylocella tundrae]WPP03137.1 LysR family transcriptional regulator [Methylocella tundrae]VFU09113.1 LysR family transcriptional regulator [Methylocella tundrae]
MDRLTSMAVFVAAADEGSLSGAARRFGLSVSMAGKHVAAIETDLNIRLMQRTTRKLSLTDVGQTYYARCKRILEEYEDANREAGDAQQSIHGVLRLAAPVTFGAMHLGDVVAGFLATHPGVTLEIMLNDRYVDLLAEGIDVAIRIGRLLDSDLVARRLAPCRMVICASPKFLEWYGPLDNVEDLRRAPRLAYSDAVSSGDWTLTDPAGQAHVIDGPTHMASNNTQMMLAAAIAGAGVAYGPSFVFGRSVAAGELVALLPHYKTTDLAIHAVYPTKRHVSLKLRSFVDHLITNFGGTPPWDLSSPE